MRRILDWLVVGPMPPRSLWRARLLFALPVCTIPLIMVGLWRDEMRWAVACAVINCGVYFVARLRARRLEAWMKRRK